MFDTRFPTYQPYALAYIQDARHSHTARLNHAHGLYNRVVRKGIFLKLLAKLLRRSRRLLDLNEYLPHMVSSSYEGVRAVCVDNIVGSSGRLDDFDMDFLPTNDRLRDRWVSIAMAADALTPLPPVELVQVGWKYFVRDGHHRISVARARGQDMVDAAVTEWRLDLQYLSNQAYQQGLSWELDQSHSEHLSLSW